MVIKGIGSWFLWRRYPKWGILYYCTTLVNRTRKSYTLISPNMGWDFSHPILFISWIFMGKFPFRVSTSNTRSAIRIIILWIFSFYSKISFKIRSWNIFVVCAKISFIYQFFILISSQCNWFSSLDLYLIDSNNLCRG